jgi:glycosyltransferase involved in cell wall biosynthesis
MEVIHIVPGKANPERMNGVNRVVNDLASHQTAAGMKVAVWGIAADTVHNYPQRNYETRLFCRQRNPFATDAVLEAALLCAGTDTVFHLHGGFVPVMYTIARLLQQHNIPYVFTPHGSYNTLALSKNKLVKGLYMRTFEQRLLRGAAVIHVLGDSEVAATRRWCGNTEVEKIPYGFVPAATTDGKVPGSTKFVVGYCGRIDMYTKGLDALVAGFGEFCAAHPQSELRIIGDGADMGKLRAQIDLAGLQQQVVLAGAQYGTDKETMLRNCHVFAHPSRNEGLPAAILEAAAMGLPCLVTEATNTGDSVARYNCGVTIEQTEPAQIADGLSRLHAAHTGGRMETLRRNAVKMIREEFNWQTLTTRYQKMYAYAAGL